MELDVRGRIRNLNLPASKPLHPLFEAIVNSIQAIEEASVKRGRIDIEVIRDAATFLGDDSKRMGAITGFTVSDNGVGFNDDNFRQFNKGDTQHKVDKGGKGIGRFLWLKAFDEVLIKSTYQAGKTYLRREFHFRADNDPITPIKEPEETSGPARTDVHLKGFQEPYASSKALPRTAALIATNIIEHCLEYFLQTSCPEIRLQDQAHDAAVSLNRIFKDELLASSKVTSVPLGQGALQVTHVHLKTTHGAEHKAFYCANDRVVKEVRLVKPFPDLAKRLTGPDNAEFTYAAYVKGEVLDESVNQERTAFNLDEDSGTALTFHTSWEHLLEAVNKSVEEHLAVHLEPVRQAKRAVVENYVQTKQVRYRHVLEYAPEVLDSIKPGSSEPEMAIQLHKKHQELEVRLLAEGSELQSGISKAGKDAEYDARMKAYMKTVTDLNSDRLADYVRHRHAVLGILQELLKLADGDKYALEKELHSVVYPMITTSDKTPEDNHNLWVVDERLAYHRYLASDKQLRTNPSVGTPSKREPDILIFDAAVAFGDALGDTPHNVVLVEFKRPMRDDYDRKENPVDQLVDYVQDIRSGNIKRHDGRPFAIQPKDINFYCYAICDVTERLKEVCKRHRLIEMMGGRGWCGYNEHYRAWIEVIPYDVMVENAIRRNRVFFNKLGLPEV